MLEGIVTGETVKAELAPLEFDPAEAEKLGIPGEEPQPGALGSVELEAAPAAQVSETQVKGILQSLFFAGMMANGGEGHEHWIATEDELEMLVPSMTKFVNQYPPLARAVEVGDTNAAPIRFFMVVAKKQIQSIRKKKEAQQANHPLAPAAQGAAQGGGDLYEGLIPPSR